MKKLSLFSAILVSCFSASIPLVAQSYTLDECIAQAIRVGVSTQQAKVNRSMAEVQQQNSRNQYLPEISASLSQTFDIGRSQDKTGVMQDRSSRNSSMGIGGSLELFSGGKRLIMDKIAKERLSGAIAREESTHLEIELQVAELFYQLVFCQEVEKLAQLQVEASREIERKTQEMVRVGKWSEGKLSEVATQRAEDEMQLVQAQNETEMAKLQLQWILENNDPHFSIITPSVEQWVQKAQNTILSAPSSIREQWTLHPALRASNSQISIAQYEKSVAQRGYMPSLSFDFGYNNSYYHLMGKDFQALNSSFADQLKSNGRTFLGLTLRIPIFDRFNTAYQVKQAELQEQLALLDKKATERRIQKELYTADLNARLSMRKIEVASAARKQALQAQEHAQWGYQEGKTSSYDYAQAQNKRLKADIEWVRSCLDFVYKARVLDCYTHSQENAQQE